MSSIDDITVCITSFNRPERLRRSIESCKQAGITKVSVGLVGDPCLEPWSYQTDFKWFNYNHVVHDIGCNDTWMLAVYPAQTKRVIVLHDDDFLLPEFKDAYETIIGPAMDSRDAGFASWRAALRFDDDTTQPTEYWRGPTTVYPSRELLAVVGNFGHLSLSPVISVLNRDIVLRACKEAGATLKRNVSLYRPGMLLGTEILVYYRHISHFKRWLYVDKVLSHYGSHKDSGTVEAQKKNTEHILANGYDLARMQGCRPQEKHSRFILVHHDYRPIDYAGMARYAAAQSSWTHHPEIFCFPYHSTDIPTINELLDYGCSIAQPEDVVIYANADTGLTTQFTHLVSRGIEKGRGVTCCITRDVPRGTMFKTVHNYKATGGIDAIAVTPQWWEMFKTQMPEMFIGRQVWDNVFCSLAEKWADGKMRDETYDFDTYRMDSNAYTDDAIWHISHDSPWKEMDLDPKQQNNLTKAREFYKSRGMRTKI